MFVVRCLCFVVCSSMFWFSLCVVGCSWFVVGSWLLVVVGACVFCCLFCVMCFSLFVSC